jgi:tetratricopeptide (TPR) repeat protein
MNNRRISPAQAIRLLTWAMAIAAATAALAQTAKPAPQPGASHAACVELADRLEAMAYYSAANYKPIPSLIHQTTALLQAAARLNPTEPRYLRLLYQAYLQSNDPDGAIAAMQAYLTLVPDDQFAQVKLINLYVSKMQTVDSILAYLHGVVTKTALPPAVRAHAAVVCAQTLLDHAQRDEALKMLDSALVIEPLNDAALKLKYKLAPDDTVSRRCGLLLAMLRSNPMDPDAAAALADNLADQGMPEASAIWYSQAANLFQLLGQPRSESVGKGGATELYLCNHGVDAAGVIDSYLNAVPADADGWAIRLAIAKDIGSDPAAFEALARRAVNEVTNRLQTVRAAMGATNATTQPSDTSDASTPPAMAPTAVGPADLTVAPTTAPAAAPIMLSVSSVDPPDMTGDIDLLAKANQQQLTDAYISAAGDLAWLRLYFLRDAGAGTQRVLDGLGKLLSPDDLLVTRLTGWSYLVQGKYDEARQKLTGIADRDPYAALGVMALDDQDGKKAEADALAKTALVNHPSGPLAAVFYSAYRQRGAKVGAGPQMAAIAAELKAFPGDWLGIVSQPQQYYTITAEPLQTDYPYGKAILCRVTILNTGDYDLTMGEQGVLRPDLVFAATAHGLVEKQITEPILDQFWQRLLLPRGQSCSQIMRLDRGAVIQLLGQQPQIPIDLLYAVTTNPIPTKQGFVIGGAGYQVAFGQMTERNGTPIGTPEDRSKIYDRITGADPADRFCAAETCVTFGLGLRSAASGDNAQQQLTGAGEMFDHARQAEADADHAVRAWAQYLFVLAAAPDQQLAAIQKLTTSDDWYARLLGVIASQRTPDHGALVAGAMGEDSDPLVKAFAKSVTDYITYAVAAAATQPAVVQPIAPALTLPPQ